ncbi:HEPN domain-containing protein [Clostridium botulinum]|uniref:HEPN domain-containing protein n=1 Tax=Clostridium botulinum TaxID=1491 RepID=UPI001C9AFBD6|nr:HEPN domain-containing protein [Clostridium botulinum]MBY6810796.1 hypothetical protein [Clostridium botulinum]MBY6824209.1 hypothetical protein [Clostridium botulinum]MBY6834663.1 hypothetical protein [Clostridium botulinum]MBY6973375.1 hypothetical protein [Clostridium botulinum]MCS6104391.1 hypothetical protein [Clostridium botulinum]
MSYTVTICAVLFGADETLLNVNLGNGFKFRRISLIPSKDNLDAIFEIDDVGLRREYETARIDAALEVICVFKSYTIYLDRTEVEKYYSKMCEDVLKYLDDIIRAIRLFVEGPVRFKKLSIKMKSEIECVDEIEVINSFSSIIPVGEAMQTNTISKFHCDYKEINELNNNISLKKFPLVDEVLNDCHGYYDLSYHQDNFISITLLITCLEILFLNSEKAKKEKLAKRCSVYLYDSKDERINCYYKLLKVYKKRSDFVHDGDCLQVENEDILFLRECVRKSLVKYLNNQHSKKDTIQELKKIIENLDYWSEKK